MMKINGRSYEFQKRNGYKTKILSTWQVQRNTPIKKYIRTIKVNMERCRWIDPTLTRVSEYINKYSRFKLTYSKNGKELESNLLVGKNKTETVVSAVHQFYCF
jgi:murein L,D-transpeptidase YcbB/YkuD